MFLYLQKLISHETQNIIGLRNCDFSINDN